MLKRGVARAVVRVACSGTSRVVIVGPAARAGTGAASAAATARRALIRGACQTTFAGKGRRPFPDTIFTTVRALLAALGLTLVFAAGAGAAQSGKRVLAIRLRPDLEVNPVTQDYVTSRISRAAKDGYDAAVILLDTP